MKKLTTSVLAVVLTASFSLVSAQKDSAKTENIQEVVITVLGVKRQEKASSYAKTRVGGDQLTEVVNSNVFETLSGKVPGVDISAPSQPGATAKVVTRGFKSLASSQPLYVIDGTPMLNLTSSRVGFDNTYDSGSTVNDIDPNIIESMNFLKGAAATALYGKDGANGVIVITTKRGKNKLKVNYSSAIDFSEVSRVPNIQYKFGEGWNGLGFSNVVGEGSNAASNENGSWGPLFNGSIRPWGRIVNNSQQLKPYVALEDAVKEFFDIGTTFSNTLSFSGGSERADGALTISDINSDGVYPTENDKFKRRSIGFNGGLNYERFKIKVSTNYINRKTNAVPTGQGDDASFGKTVFQELLQMPNDVSFVDMQDMGNIFNTPSYFFTPYASNPYTTIANNNVRVSSDRFFGNINFSYELTKNLFANLQFGADILNETTKRWGAIVEYIPGSPQALAKANGVVGAVREAKLSGHKYDSFFTLNHSADFSDNWKLNSAAGVGYNQESINSVAAQVTDLDLPNFYELSNSASTPVVGQNDLLRRYIYVYGSAELGFKNRYFLTATGRNDWTSTLPIGKNSYFYPSVGLAAIVLDSNKAFLKLRGNWAQVGQDTDPYQVYSIAAQTVNDGNFGQLSYPFGGVNSYEIGAQVANEDLVNQLTTELELGAEARFFNGRIGLDVAAYNRLTEDILLPKVLPRSTGYSSILGNFGSVRNKGIELLLDLKPIKTNNFEWNLTYTFTKNKGKVENIVGDDNQITVQSNYGISFKFVEGEDPGTFYALVPKMTSSGQYIVNPDTGYYEVSDKEEKIGTSQRDFIMGFRNEFRYKSISLIVGIDWKQGGQMYSYTKRLSHFTGNGIETIYNDRNPFIIPNSVIDNGDGTYSENTTPVSYENITNFYNTQQNPGIERSHVIDKTFVRLRDVSLNYRLPKKWFESLGINDASFTIYGKNLFLWTPKDNPYVDPEATTYGADGLGSEFGEFSANPTQRTYGFMFKFNF